MSAVFRPLEPPLVGCALRTDPHPDGAQSAPYAGGEKAASVADRPRPGDVASDAAGGWEAAPRGWYASLLAGALPLFSLGMLASALVDRLDFAGWAIVAGAGHALLLRAAWVREWSVPARTALVLGWAALALLAFAPLVERHQEVLDLGYRALLWPLYTSLLTRPLTAQVGAAALALAAVAVLVVARIQRRGGAAS